MPFTGSTVQYPGLLFQDLVQFEDGYLQTYSIGPSPAGKSLTGQLGVFQNTDSSGYVILDRIKISVDPSDVSQNYLVFVKQRYDGTFMQNYTCPINQVVAGNPNYTNLYLIVKNGEQLQCCYVAVSQENTISQSISFRVRKIDKYKAEI